MYHKGDPYAFDGICQSETLEFLELQIAMCHKVPSMRQSLLFQHV